MKLSINPSIQLVHCFGAENCEIKDFSSFFSMKAIKEFLELIRLPDAPFPINQNGTVTFVLKE